MNDQAYRNLTAFLTMLSISEGTAGIGDNGYDCIVGSTPAKPHLFTTYADHPRIAVELRADKVGTIANEHLASTAAGRYQILARNYDAYRKMLRLPDFSPASQDRIAMQMVREQRAMDDVLAGRVEAAIVKCANIWASLPGAGYKQHENSMAQCVQWFKGAGGVIV